MAMYHRVSAASACADTATESTAVACADTVTESTVVPRQVHHIGTIPSTGDHHELNPLQRGTGHRTIRKEQCMAFDYAAILARYDDYPSIRLYYRYPDESGWASRLDETHAMLDNVPATGGIMARDICTCTRHEGDLPRLDSIVQRYYRWQWSVTYVVEGAASDPEAVTAAYTTIRMACQAAGCAIEGMSTGWAIVNAPEAVDLRAVLEPLGIRGEALVLYQPRQ
jgi:hypothetical protein